MGKTVGNLDKHIQIDLSNFSVNGHTHSYVPLSGGTMTGNLKFADVTSTTYPAVSSKITWNGSTDGADIYYQVDASDKGRLVLNTRDDSDCVIAFANKGTIKTTIDANGNFSGKAAKADTLNTARTLTIGNTGKTFNGSANVTWSLSEIGAAPTSHDHQHLLGEDLSSKTISLNTLNLSAGTPKFKVYYCPTDGGGSNITERPNDSYKTAFNLIVESLRWASTTDYITKQTYTRGGEKIVYIRYCTNGTWTTWEKVYTSAQKPTYSDVGAAAASHGTHVTYATATPKANGTAAIGSVNRVAREDHVHPLQTSVAQLTTARTLTIGNTGKTFNGTANVSWSLSEIGAVAKTGDTMSGTLEIKHGTTSKEAMVKATRSDTSVSTWLGVGSGGTNHGVYSDKLNKWMVYADGSNVFLNGSAEKLTTARTLTIGNTGKTFNGSANVAWSLSEIGAIAKIKIPTSGDQSTYVKIMEIEDASSGNRHAEALVVGEGNYGTTQHTFGILRISSRGNRLVEYTTLLAHDSGTFEVGYVRDDTNKKTIVYLKRGAYPGGGAIIPLSEVGCSFITSLTNLTTAPTGYTAGTTRTMALTTSNVASATKLATARTISLGGVLSGSASFDGSANASISASIAKPPKSGDWFSGGIPTVSTGGVMEIGKYIDFHNTDASTNDFDVRLQCNTAGPIELILPTTAGTLARTADNVASATKLQTARTLTIGNTGKTFDGSANVSWTLADIGALPTAGGTMTGILTIGPVAYDSGYTKAGTFTDTNVKRSMIKFAAVSGSNDPGAIYLETSATTADINKGVLHLCPSDDPNNDGTDYVSIHGTNDAENIKLHTGGAASFAGTVTAPTFSGALSGNAATATKATQLTTARKINGTSFNGTADITTANWGTSRYINRISVNGSADVKLPLDYYTCSVSNDNTNLYHHILASGQCTGDYTDKSITIVLVNHYNGAGLGIAKATLRTNKASDGGTATAELRWLVRSGFSENQLCYNIRNTAQDTYMDVFYKSSGTYNSLTWYVLTEGARGSQNSNTWTKNNTNASGTNAYTEANMKTIRTYTSTLVSATDHGNVNYAKSANTATTASAANVLNSNTRMDYGWSGLNYFNINGTAGNAAKANDTPTTAWWHIIRCNHANSAGYYTDIAVPFNATSMYYKRITGGAVQNSGWVQILDKLNYKSIATPANIGAEVATATHSTVDITSSGFTSKGTKTADTMASTGNCYSLTSATSSMVLASGNFNAVKFGKYALCLRIMSSNITSTANILTVTVKHDSTTLLTKNIKGTDFTSTSQYSNIYTSFDFNGTSNARGTLSVQISTGTTSGITFKFDYAYITLMTPSVFI